MKRAFCLLAFLPVWAMAQEPVLLLHQRVPRDGSGQPIVSDIAISIAQEFATVFRMNPIVWSLNDAQFRDAVYNKLAPEDVYEPTQEQMDATARTLRAPFFAIITVKTEQDLIGTMINVYRTGQKRPAWSKTLETKVQVGGVNSRLQAEQALARSWGFELRQGLFKPYIRAVEVPTPDPNQGTAITPDPTTPIPRPDNPDISDVQARVQQLVASRQSAEALTVLWEAVDQRPQNLELRRLLISTLIANGPAEEAVEECRRALLLWPGEEAFRLAHIRGLLALERSDEAASELNEALARDPNNLEVIELKGHVALLRGLLAQAREAYMAVLAKEPRAGVQASLALTVALEGDTAEARRLMNTLPPTDPGVTLEVYRRLATGSRQALDRMATELREVLRLGRLQPGTANVINRAQRVFKACEGLNGVLSAARVPDVHKASHDRRVLAQKLLTQASAEILQFTRSGNPDSGDEATLSLGEALRAYAEAQTWYESEK